VDSNWPQACPDAPLSLQAGDTLRIRFAYWPELDEQEAIRPDGKISLSLIGDVTAAGVTPEQLRAELLTQYADKIKDPEITIIVQSLDSRRVYIGGEVRLPGVVAMPAKMTLPQAIMQAGGFLKDSAKLSSVVVVRQRDGSQQSCSVDVRKMFEDPKSDQFLLEPFDIVYVPRTSIDRVDQWVEQYINKIVPRNIYATFSVNKTKTNVDDNNQDIQTVVTLP
jgi:protein involved in polysaccharide export with SLBB domain